MDSMLQVKTLYHTEKQGFGYPWLSKNSRHTHQNLLKLTQFQKGQPTPAKLHMLLLAHLWVREFWPQIYSL